MWDGQRTTLHFTRSNTHVIFFQYIYQEVLKKGIRMPFAISIIVDNESVPAELNDTDTALAIIDNLPLEAEFSTWGDEIYFSIPVKMGLQNGKDVVEKGELAYWPPGNAFCIFYGATPGSSEDEIRPASPVNPIGKIKGDPNIFKTLASVSNIIRIEEA